MMTDVRRTKLKSFTRSPHTLFVRVIYIITILLWRISAPIGLEKAHRFPADGMNCIYCSRDICYRYHHTTLVTAVVYLGIVAVNLTAVRRRGRVRKRFGKWDERTTTAAVWKETVQSIIHGALGVKRPLKRLKKKRERERERDEKRPFRFSVRILIYFRKRPLFPVRGRFTLRTSIVYGRIFTTQTPFYNVAISKVYSPQRPENGTVVGGFGPYNTYWPCVDFYFSGYRVVVVPMMLFRVYNEINKNRAGKKREWERFLIPSVYVIMYIIWQ